MCGIDGNMDVSHGEWGVCRPSGAVRAAGVKQLERATSYAQSATWREPRACSSPEKLGVRFVEEEDGGAPGWLR